MKRYKLFVAGFLWFCALTVPAMAWAFDDDSTDDSQPNNLIGTLCDDGRTVRDTERIKFSCNGDEAYLDRNQPFLYKNNVRVGDRRVRDFKLARNGKLFYRTLSGSYLYDEKGQLESGSVGVAVYLVSSSGDVLYITQTNRLYKNGEPVNSSTAIPVPLIRDDRMINSRFHDFIANPKISRNGKAIYVNANRNLYINDVQINSSTFRVRAFKINSLGDVYFIDTRNRLFRNSEVIYSGPFQILKFDLNIDGKVAYLVDSGYSNLYLDDERYSAGANRIVDFQFNNRGEILYQDSLRRLWKENQLLND